jgi:hypothetical protein
MCLMTKPLCTSRWVFAAAMLTAAGTPTAGQQGMSATHNQQAGLQLVEQPCLVWHLTHALLHQHNTVMLAAAVASIQLLLLLLLLWCCLSRAVCIRWEATRPSAG